MTSNNTLYELLITDHIKEMVQAMENPRLCSSNAFLSTLIEEISALPSLADELLTDKTQLCHAQKAIEFVLDMLFTHCPMASLADFPTSIFVDAIYLDRIVRENPNQIKADYKSIIDANLETISEVATPYVVQAIIRTCYDCLNA